MEKLRRLAGELHPELLPVAPTGLVGHNTRPKQHGVRPQSRHLHLILQRQDLSAGAGVYHLQVAGLVHRLARGGDWIERWQHDGKTGRARLLLLEQQDGLALDSVGCR